MGIVDYNQTIDTTNPSVVDPNNLLSDYVVDGKLTVALDCIFINGVKFKGVSRDSTLGYEEFVWAKEPTRSNSFAFGNMDDIDVGLVAQCQVNFKYFNIDDFMRFREAIKQRYFNVIFFNVDTAQWAKREMYCSKNQRDKLYYFNPKLIGILDFTITLVATNRDLEHENVNITYNANGNSFVVPSMESVKYATQYKLDSAPNITGKTFLYWTDRVDTESTLNQKPALGWHFFAGDSFTAFKDMTLYAIYKEV